MKYTQEEWKDWATSAQTKEFIKLIEERRRNKLEDLSCCTEQDSLVKDYFKIVGFCDGMMDIKDLIREMKEK